MDTVFPRLFEKSLDTWYRVPIKLVFRKFIILYLDADVHWFVYFPYLVIFIFLYRMVVYKDFQIFLLVPSARLFVEMLLKM